MRLNPFYPVNYLAALADALVHQDRRSEALDVLGTIVKRNPNYLSAHLHLAGTPRACRRLGEGKGCVAEVLRINPAYRLTAARRFYLSSDQARQGRFVDLLREAGLPD
jgi:hypothetical protein